MKENSEKIQNNEEELSHLEKIPNITNSYVLAINNYILESGIFRSLTDQVLALPPDFIQSFSKIHKNPNIFSLGALSHYDCDLTPSHIHIAAMTSLIAETTSVFAATIILQKENIPDLDARLDKITNALIPTISDAILLFGSKHLINTASLNYSNHLTKDLLINTFISSFTAIKKLTNVALIESSDEKSSMNEILQAYVQRFEATAAFPFKLYFPQTGRKIDRDKFTETLTYLSMASQLSEEIHTLFPKDKEINCEILNNGLVTIPAKIISMRVTSPCKETIIKLLKKEEVTNHEFSALNNSVITNKKNINAMLQCIIDDLYKKVTIKKKELGTKFLVTPTGKILDAYLLDIKQHLLE